MMLEGLKPVSAMQKCRIRTVAKELDTKESVLFMGYIDDLSFPAEQLADQLKKAGGIVIGSSSIRKHRAGSCWCAKLAEC